MQNITAANLLYAAVVLDRQKTAALKDQSRLGIAKNGMKMLLPVSGFFSFPPLGRLDTFLMHFLLSHEWRIYQRIFRAANPSPMKQYAFRCLPPYEGDSSISLDSSLDDVSVKLNSHYHANTNRSNRITRNVELHQVML